MSASSERALPAKLARVRSNVSDVVLREASDGLDRLLCGEFDGAVKLMKSRPESPWHVLTLGIMCARARACQE
jgi:hypothetical protein